MTTQTGPVVESRPAPLPVRPASVPAPPPSRIKELDGLRGVAVLAVIADHYLSWLPALGTQYGRLGVDLFFILSGFLITSILLDLRGNDHYFKIFYLRRALRIFPPYYLAIIVYLGVSVALGRPGTLGLWSQYVFYYTSLFLGQPPQLHAFPPSVPLTVVLGLAVLWSLSVEELYYTIWAPVVRFTTRRAFTGILAGMILIAPLLRFCFHTHDFPEVYTFYCRMDGLAYGSAVALLIHERRRRPGQWVENHRLFKGLALGVFLITALFWLLTHGDQANRWVTSVGFVMADLSFALVAYGLITRAGGGQIYVKIFRSPWLCSIGTVSYSLYLFHYPLWNVAIMLVDGLHWPRRVSAVLDVLVGLVLSFTVAYALWYGMESRILRWKNRHEPVPMPR